MVVQPERLPARTHRLSSGLQPRNSARGSAQSGDCSGSWDGLRPKPLVRCLPVFLILWVWGFSPWLGAESRHYREAKEWHDKQQNLMAMLSAQKAVEEDPENADHLLLYGVILTDLQQFSEAGVQLRKALNLRPDEC